MNAIRIGGILLAMGLVVFALSILTGATVGCTAVGYSGEPPGGFELKEIDVLGLDIVYTPDGGINTCSMDFGYIFAPLGLGAIALGSLVGGVGCLREWF
ncbi:hypothetical protein [Halorussus halophilus]|uniref:hypothetical protein n=1 Tax=Halorussus halophilus TaxID=2650975 RepID=UPI001300CDB9|nr:hypothetical protein [Halorussus halophilus]